MNDPALRNGLVTRAHETAARYSWDETAARNEAVYAAFLAGG
jgi:hypothetical protein